MKKKISSFYQKMFNVCASDPAQNHWIFGKKINVFVENEMDKIPVPIGILNSIKKLISSICLLFNRKNLVKLSIGNHEFLVNEIGDFSLKSIGILKDVNCKVEFSD